MHFTIVSYTFPPSTDIGGRRWAKFSQQLIKRGHEVTVVCTGTIVDYDWYKQEYPGIKIILLPKRYPEWLSGFTKSLYEKLAYKFYTRFLNLFTKQNLFDRGYLWKNTMLEALEVIHNKKSIDTLIVTGAPFSLLYYGSLFKKQHQEIQYVADLRDPWTWGSYYGIPKLSNVKKRFQNFSEFNALEASDMICYPTEHMGNVLKKKYPSFVSKFYLLPHAYDPEKFPNFSSEIKRQGFVYGGTLYDGIEDYLKKLDLIVKANTDSGFTWDIYTGTNYPLINSEFANGTVRKHGFIPEDKLFEKIQHASAYLAFFPIMDKDLVSTKFFEIVYTRTPILYVGEEGDVGKFIRDNRLGIHILPENMERDLPKYLSGDIPVENGYFDVTNYTFSSVTENFLIALKHFKN